MRTRWDPLEDDNDLILAELDHLREVGVTHVVPEPRQRTLDDYLRSIDPYRHVTTTHFKQMFIQRNGVPVSPYAVMHEYFIRHGDRMMLMPA